jgi:uncharacterized membrane protein
MGLSAAFQALVWTTIGFVIAERSGEKAEKAGGHGWKAEDLPEVQKDEKANIPLSESIAELIVIVVFSIVGLLFCTGRLPFKKAFSDGNLQFLISSARVFWRCAFRGILVSLVLAVVEGVARKSATARWSVFVCAAVVLKSLVDMAFSLFLINRRTCSARIPTAFWRARAYCCAAERKRNQRARHCAFGADRHRRGFRVRHRDHQNGQGRQQIDGVHTDQKKADTGLFCLRGTGQDGLARRRIGGLQDAPELFFHVSVISILLSPDTFAKPSMEDPTSPLAVIPRVIVTSSGESAFIRSMMA